MKNILNRSTEQLTSTLKREPSLKAVHLNKMGQTASSFHVEKLVKKHCRTKTDDLMKTLSTSSTCVDAKFKTEKEKPNEKDKHNRKKVHSEVELRKISSHRVLDATTKIKPSSCYKPTVCIKETKSEYTIMKSLQKMRKKLNETNPEIVSEELKVIAENDIKNPLTIECYLLSNDLLTKIKKMNKKHSHEINSQKQTFERREHKLMQKILELETKNQRCSVLINELRVQNIDIDTIWHNQGLHEKTMFTEEE